MTSRQRYGADYLHALLNVVTGGDDETIQAVARRLAGERDHEALSFLAETAGSSHPQRVRSRCLEVLARALGEADRATSDLIIDTLRTDPHPDWR
jgi:hypothetical protein